MKQNIIVLTFICTFFPFIGLFAQIEGDSSSAVSEEISNFFDLELEELLNVEITTASKSSEKIEEAPAIVSIVTKKDIELYGANDLFDVLDRVISTFTLGTAFIPDNMVSIRGDASTHYNNRVLVLIDGRPYRENFSGGLRMAFNLMYPLDRVERIEIIRGPGAVLYGSGAYTGVINVITKSAENQETGVKLTTGSFGRNQAQLFFGKKGKELEVTGGLSILDEKGWEFGAYDAGFFGPRTFRIIDMKRSGFLAETQLKYKGFKFSTFYGNSLQRSMYFPGAWSFYPQVINGGDTTSGFYDFNLVHHTVFADLGYTKNLNKNIILLANITTNGMVLNEASEYAIDNIAKAKSLDVLGEVSANFNYLEGKLTAVVGGLVNRISGYQDFPVSIKVPINTNDTSAGFNPIGLGGFGSYNLYNYNRGKNPDPFKIIDPYMEIQSAGYAQIGYQPFRFLKLVSGVQVNKIPGIKLNVVPRFALISNFTKALGMKLLYGQAFRSASSTERFIEVDFVLGNPNLKSEIITTTEAAIFLRGKKINSMVTFFRNEQKNLINRSPTALTATESLFFLEKYTNTGSRYTQGLEWEMNASPISGFWINASLTGMQSEDKVKLSSTNVNSLGNSTTTENSLTIDNLQSIPMMMAKLGLNYQSEKGYQIGLFNSWFDGVPLHRNKTSIEDSKIEKINPGIKPFNWLTANVVIDLAKVMKISQVKGTTVSFFAKNILDNKVYVADLQDILNSIPGRGGRQVYVTLKSSF